MRRFLSFLCTVLSVLFIVSIIFSSIELIMFNDKFYDLEYRKLDTARALETRQSDLLRVTHDLLDYLKGDLDDIRGSKIVSFGENRRAFNDDEATHMEDVRNLYQAGKMVRNIGFLGIILAIAVVLIAIKKEKANLLAISYLRAAIIIGSIILLLGLWALIHFESFWTCFHLLFFRNDLWYMDPRTSFMINMFPTQFWFDACGKIFRNVAVGVGIPAIASIALLIIEQKRRNTILTIKEGKNQNDLPLEFIEDVAVPIEETDGSSNEPGKPMAPWQ